ncbi:hypothetical protein AAE478_001193 [Parahypoxylon ruwenzoriense]
MSAEQTQSESRPPRLTFGVEMEFLVPWLYVDAEDPHGDVKGLSPVLRLIRTRTFQPYEADDIVRDIIKGELGKHGLDGDVSAYRYSSEAAKEALISYAGWGVVGDSSVAQPFDDSDYEWANKYAWVGVEIQSPAEPDTPTAFKAIDYVRSILTRTYRMRVNHSCGLHVHVGPGAERFPLGAMRRIASLAWAAEHLLANLNHPWRQANINCRLVRDRSNMSRGMPTGPYHSSAIGRAGVFGDGIFWSCNLYVGQDVRHGEEPISWREENFEDGDTSGFEQTRQEGHWEPFQVDAEAPDTDTDRADTESSLDDEVKARVRRIGKGLDTSNEPTEPGRTRTIPRIKNPHYTVEQLEKFALNLEPYGGDGLEFGEGSCRVPDPGVFAGVRQLYECSSSCDIAAHMEPGSRGFINFDNYSCMELTIPTGSRTVEFRGAEGTLGPWVSTWAKICVGFVKFAVHAPAEEFLRVLVNCDISTREDGKYDCIDLLDDLGLPAEAAAAEKRIEEYGDDWGLEYVEE